MVALDELTQEPDRHQLNPDHDEKHSEEQKWSRPDCVTGELEHRHVGADCRPEEGERDL